MDDSDPVIDRYRLALGTFIHDFAMLEAFLFDLLCAAAGVSSEIGGALFSGARAENLMSLTKRCYEASETEFPPFLQRAFSQITVLNHARNDAVHFVTLGMQDDEEQVLATSALRNMPSRAKEIVTSPAGLEAMSKDARVIPALLMVATYEIRDPGSIRLLSESVREPSPPWHYTPAGQDSPRRRE